MQAKIMTDYAFYHGDEFLDLGSLDYLCKKFNKPRKLLKYYSYKSNRERNPNGFQLLKLEAD